MRPRPPRPAGPPQGPPTASRRAAPVHLRPVACGGVAVFPDDVIVLDGDGAVLIPAALVAEVIPLALEQERLEAWIMEEVAAGASLPGLYPPDAANRARYEATRRGG